MPLSSAAKGPARLYGSNRQDGRTCLPAGMAGLFVTDLDVEELKQCYPGQMIILQRHIDIPRKDFCLVLGSPRCSCLVVRPLKDATGASLTDDKGFAGEMLKH